MSAQFVSESVAVNTLPWQCFACLRNRSKVVICWEILRALAAGPQGPSKLARVANVPFDRLDDYLGLLISGALVRVESVEGHDLYHLTPDGMQGLADLDRVLPKLFGELSTSSSHNL